MYISSSKPAKEKQRNTYAGSSSTLKGIAGAYIVPSTSYHSCSNVDKPLNNPSVEFAVTTASPPSAGTINVYPSLLFSKPMIASSEMLLTSEPLARERRRPVNVRAERKDGTSDEPLPTKSLPRLSLKRRERERSIACERSSGVFGMSDIIENCGERSSTSSPIEIDRGIGQIAWHEYIKAETLVSTVREAILMTSGSESDPDRQNCTTTEETRIYRRRYSQKIHPDHGPHDTSQHGKQIFSKVAKQT